MSLRISLRCLKRGAGSDHKDVAYHRFHRAAVVWIAVFDPVDLFGDQTGKPYPDYILVLQHFGRDRLVNLRDP